LSAFGTTIASCTVKIQN